MMRGSDIQSEADRALARPQIHQTAIAFLFVGLAIGGWMIARRELSPQYAAPYEVGAHTHADRPQVRSAHWAEFARVRLVPFVSV